jgi:hypothetical protein
LKKRKEKFGANLFCSSSLKAEQKQSKKGAAKQDYLQHPFLLFRLFR